VNNPLDDALGKMDADSARREADETEQTKAAAEARERLIQAIEDFLRRMDGLGNPGLSDFEKKHFRKVQAWFIGWVWSDYRGSFWLKPDGTSLEHNEWVPLKDKVLFGVDALGRPSSLGDTWPGMQHSSLIRTHLDKAIAEMASIVYRYSQKSIG